jgi:hypothetical protein
MTSYAEELEWLSKASQPERLAWFRGLEMSIKMGQTLPAEEMNQYLADCKAALERKDG